MININQKGASIIEILAALALAGITFAGGLMVLGPSLRVVLRSKQKDRVAGIIQTNFEIIRSLRSENWNALAVNGEYHYEDIEGEESGLTLVAGPELIEEKYTVRIILSDVYRDANMDILETGTVSQIDNNTRKATVRVDWDFYGVTQTESQGLYLTNWGGF